MARIQADLVRRQLHSLAGRYNDPRATDRELLRRFALHRDESAFAALFRRHGAMVLAVGGRVLGNTHDAEDVCQAAFLVLARKASCPRWQTSVAGWLHRTAHLLALKARTASSRRARREKTVVARPPAAPPAEVTGRELLAALDEELRALPEPLAAPLVLRYLEGASRGEAARQLGCPLATLKHRLERGLDRLRRALARRGLGLPAALAAALGSPQTSAAAPVSLLARKTTATALALAAGAMVPSAVGRLFRGGSGFLIGNRLCAVPALLLLGGLLVAAGARVYSARPGEPAAPAPRGAPAPARDQGTTLRYQFKPGDQLRYVVESRLETRASVPGHELSTSTTHTCDVTWKVTGVDPDGSARVTLTVERLRFVLEHNPSGKVEFDSRKHKKPEGVTPLAPSRAAVLKAYAGAEFTCTVSPRGEVRDFKVPRKITDALRGSPAAQTLYSPESFRQQLARPGGGGMPDEALAKGGHWYEKSGTPVVGGHARLAVSTRATYQGRADRDGKRLVDIALEPTVTAVERTPAGALGPFALRNQDGKGHVLFDNERGRLVESVTTQSVELESGNAGGKVQWDVKLSRSAKLNPQD